jgi:hypothetical protein
MMNPFVNPKKRGITLPDGCKDLIDVLERPRSKRNIAIHKFIRLLLFQTHQDQATELVIGIALPGGGTPLRYKVKDTWHDMSPFPSHVRHVVISELMRMSNLSTGQIPGNGLLNERFGQKQLKWSVAITSLEGECRLVQVPD